MQVYCQYSGLQMATIDDGLPHAILQCHPIFNLSLPDLFKLIQSTRSQNPTLRPMQMRLFYLALLLRTGLVDWQAPFHPSQDAIEATFSNLLALHSQLTLPIPADWNIPKVRISKETCANLDLQAIISTWRQAIAIYKGTPQKQAKPAVSEADLAIALSESWNRLDIDKAMRPDLVEWAVDQIEEYYGNEYAPTVYTTWTALLCRPASKVAAHDYHHLCTLREILADILPTDDKHRMKSYMVQKHVQNQLDNLTKLEANLAGNSTQRVRISIADVTTYKIVATNPLEGKQFQQAQEKPMPEKPQRTAYQTTSEYLNALLAYNAAYYAAKGNSHDNR